MYSAEVTNQQLNKTGKELVLEMIGQRGRRHGKRRQLTNYFYQKNLPMAMGLSWTGGSRCWMGRMAMDQPSPWLGSRPPSLWEMELMQNLRWVKHSNTNPDSYQPLPQRPAAVARIFQPMPGVQGASALPGGTLAKTADTAAWDRLERTWSEAHLSCTPDWSPQHIPDVGIETVRVLAIFWNCCDDFCLLLARPGNNSPFFPCPLWSLTVGFGCSCLVSGSLGLLSRALINSNGW